MSRFVALLRGVNVGKAKRVPMAEWRELLASLGYREVQTLMNSGNAVFESSGRSTAAHASRIRDAIAESMGVEVPVIVKSAAEIAGARAENALAAQASNPAALLAAFTGRPEDLRALGVVAPTVKAPERFLLGKYAAYLWCPNGFLQSTAAEALLGKAGRAATTRNWATVGKIAALLDRKGD